MGLEPDQPLDVVTAREAGHRMATMLVNAAHQVVGDADIERAVVPAGEHVDVVRHAALQP
jgi:hypothetical protein